jgi:hypothetical protein
MHHFWSVAVKPIIEAVDPEAIVEIGVDFGHNTRNILESPFPAAPSCEGGSSSTGTSA